MVDPVPREIARHELRNESGVASTFVSKAEVLAAFASAPVLDPERFRSDIDAIAEQDPFNRDC